MNDVLNSYHWSTYFLTISFMVVLGRLIFSQGSDRSRQFDNFLKINNMTNTNEIKATNIEAFIKSKSSASTTLREKNQQPIDHHKNQSITTLLDRNTPVVPIYILFGTEYGLSKEIAQKLAIQLNQTNVYYAMIRDMADINPSGFFQMKEEQTVVIICSTQGDGVPPSNCRKFYDQLHSTSQPELSTLRFCVLALGDSNYAHFCKCGKDIDLQMNTLQAKRMLARRDVDQEDWDVINSWIQQLCNVLPTFNLLQKMPADLQLLDSAKKEKILGTKEYPYMSTLQSRKFLTNKKDAQDKETIHFEFELPEDMTYLPGDALGIYAYNNSSEVDNILQLFHAKGDEHVQVPSWHCGTEEKSMPLKDALMQCYDLHNLKTSLFQVFRNAIPDTEVDETIQNRWNNLIVGGLHVNSNNVIDGYLKHRYLEDVLRDFNLPNMKIQDILPHLRPLQPRLYSVSSCLLASSNRVTIAVAVVRYKCPILGREREGVCTKYLSECVQVGQKCAVYIHSNPDFRLPSSLCTPLIMVGPGTGVAPFRAFIQQRYYEKQNRLNEEIKDKLQEDIQENQEKMKKNQEDSEALLFFGCRQRNQDFLYREELEAWHSTNEIHLVTAFSREQTEKVYVQEKICSSSLLIWQLLESGAHFYVCGDAHQMAGSVEKELLTLIAKQGEYTQENAQTYLNQLSRNGRYQRDVWF